MNKIISDLTPFIVILIAAFFLALIPFKVIGYGYLPPDDAFRHAAKVISGKPWNEILILRPEIKMDSHPGWHALLGFVHRVTGCDAHSLILFSIVFLFLVLMIPPVFFLRRPESWLISAGLLSIFSPPIYMRFLMGRPYILSTACLIIICLLWPRLKNRKFPVGPALALTAIIAASTWIHCAWYLYLLPITAFFLAREWRAGFIFTACAVAGILGGAALTGHPVMFLKQTIAHAMLAFGNNESEFMLVSEFRPGFADMNLALIVALIAGWQGYRGRLTRSVFDNPVFILSALCFVLVFISKRFWIDWGVPALAVWIALQFDGYPASGRDKNSWRRIPLTAILGGVLFFSVTTDVGSRWTSCRPHDYLSAENPETREWLPGPGGIIYNNDMGTFYRTFYANPHANWRYILGFEPALMPQEDLNIYREIQKKPWTYMPYYGWVKKMRPEDRMILSAPPGTPPRIPDLEWNYAALGAWIGRLPRTPPKQEKQTLNTKS